MISDLAGGTTSNVREFRYNNYDRISEDIGGESIAFPVKAITSKQVEEVSTYSKDILVPDPVRIHGNQYGPLDLG